MKTTITSLLLVSALLIPMAGFAADGDSVSTKVSDSVITTKVKAEFAKDKLVSATALKVETDSHGMVEISGTAKSKAEAEKAVSLAKNVKGVTSVKDKIIIAQ
ncbi:MAG: BON domain-containing protein [Methylophilaceae bacterium]|nr:BON domain-containing protein [Methylophilaceae bacterium]